MSSKKEGENMALSENAKKLLELLQKKSMTRKQLARELDVNERTVNIRINELKKSGYAVTKKDNAYMAPVSIDDVVERFNYDLPTSTYTEPVEIKTKDPEGFKLAFANTIYAGGKTNHSLVRNLLKYCQADSVDALVLTGNTVWMDLTKYSKYKPDRAQSSEFVPNPADIEYAECLKEKKKGPIELMEEKKPVFVTFKERFDMILNYSLAPLFLDENKKPLYEGPVYVAFGQVEEELARQHTNDLVRKEVIREKLGIKDEMNLIKEQIKECKKMQKELKKESKGKKQKTAPEDKTVKLGETIESLLTKLDDLKQHDGRISMTNVDEQFVNLAYSAMKNYIKERIEQTIPNCKVISTGDGFIKAGGEVIKIVPSADKMSKRVSDNLLDKLVEKTRENLQLGEKPYMIVAGGLSSTYTQVPVAYVDSTQNGAERPRTITLLQLPTCLDDKSLTDLIKSKVIAAGNDMTKLATKNDFSPGALIVEKTSGIQKRKFLTTHYLSNDKAFEDAKKIKEHQMFYGANFSDQHHGSKYVSLIETKDSIEDAFRVAQDILAAIKAPIVRITSLGDELQARNYDTAAEGHVEDLLPGALEKKITELHDKIKDPEQLRKEINKLAVLTRIRSGIAMPKDQKDDFVETLNYDLLKMVLENYRNVKMTGPMFQIIEGNHSMHTYEGLSILSKDMAREIQLQIGATKDEVTAPIFSKMGLYVGTFGVNGHYQYGEYSRHKQGGAKNSKDPTRSTRTAFTKRGQDFPDLIDRFTVNRAGHTHMGGQTGSRIVFHDIGYCFMDRNEYGEQFNFGSPARGFKVEGQPVDGWQYGPLITIDFPIEYLHKWANEKPKIEVDKLFENSIIKPKK